MGKGNGFRILGATVTPGRIMFEIDGVDFDTTLKNF